METTAATALWFLPFVVPIAIWVAWSDMKFMKIPNKAVLALAAVFLVVGPIALPLAEWGWRWTHLAVVLVIGFLMSMATMIGAGDAKFAAAMAPFIALGDLGLFMGLLAAALLGAFLAHRLLRAWPAFRNATPDWVSWTHHKFPMGLALGGALVMYLVAALRFGA
ncbi:MAG: prepilin peptidase [Gemmobacter sp.]